ncbi:uncharacterized protein [Pituophis catenifer annectens]|uniref:uncharacterized protein n=1 Tax=Pituophis catenifer annectens TaxID=94852 RepID=UPI003996BEE5
MATLPKHKQPSERRTSRLIWLLTAHLVSSYFMFIEAQKMPDFTIVLTPRFPTEGQNVEMVPQKPTNETQSCLWYRGENITYVQILLYYPMNNTFEPQRGYHSGHVPLKDCVLTIRNVSYLDMGLYGIIMKSPTKSLTGEAFLSVTREDVPTKKKKKALGAGIIAGISAGCLVGLLMVIGLVAYQTRGTTFRSATTTQQATSSPTQDTSANKDANQTTASNQNPDAEGNKI